VIHFEISKCKTELEILEKQTQEPDFWNDIGNTAPVLKKIKSVKETVNTYINLETELSNLIELNELLLLEKDIILEKEVLKNTSKIEKKLEKLELEKEDLVMKKEGEIPTVGEYIRYLIEKEIITDVDVTDIEEEIKEIIADGFIFLVEKEEKIASGNNISTKALEKEEKQDEKCKICRRVSVLYCRYYSCDPRDLEIVEMCSKQYK